MRKLIVGLAIVAVVCVATNLEAAHSSYGCSNCHVPHWAVDPAVDPDAYGVPLFSPAQISDGLPTYDLYTSQSFDALATDIGQPDGPSKLCLGCHDGTYSHVDDPRATFLAGDLKRSHPISFTYDSALSAKVLNGSLLDPNVALSGLTPAGTIAQDMLTADKLQCSSCHDVHKQGIGDYLLRFPSIVTLCKTCHDK
ncbi:hypothetical protein LCGC14_0254110 [marine sediment metagenome]|uniref:Doubled CXXCH motif domain-containing protein n=1 Tax=marine sediment metagenome TaxID=412755 RepID=A0A0F9U3S5_9ZZZZ|nr:cytochrome C [Phycisphaerae bacterium]HDZ45109.1 cytochrome C [Phycisphaerae bacterium]